MPKHCKIKSPYGEFAYYLKKKLNKRQCFEMMDKKTI